MLGDRRWMWESDSGAARTAHATTISFPACSSLPSLSAMQQSRRHPVTLRPEAIDCERAGRAARPTPRPSIRLQAATALADSIARARKSSRARGSAIVIQDPAGAICNGTPPAVANFCKLCKSWSTLHVVHDDDGLFRMEAHHLLCVVIVGCGHDVDRSALLVPVAGKSPRTPLRAQAGARVALEPWAGAFATPPLHGQRKRIPVHVRRCLVGMREVTRRSSGAISPDASAKVRASRPATAGGGGSIAIAVQDGAMWPPTWHERGATVAAAPPGTFATAADERAVLVPAPRLLSGRAAEPLPGLGAQQSIALMFRMV